jgi:hypothetical protein
MDSLMRTTQDQGLDFPVTDTPAVAIVSTETATFTQVASVAENPFEEDVHVRADTITVVLSKILEQPPVIRNWGINE